MKLKKIKDVCASGTKTLAYAAASLGAIYLTGQSAMDAMEIANNPQNLYALGDLNLFQLTQNPLIKDVIDIPVYSLVAGFLGNNSFKKAKETKVNLENSLN